MLPEDPATVLAYGHQKMYRSDRHDGLRQEYPGYHHDIIRQQFEQVAGDLRLKKVYYWIWTLGRAEGGRSNPNATISGIQIKVIPQK